MNRFATYRRFTNATALLGAALLAGCGGSNGPAAATGANPPTTTGQACSDTGVTPPPTAAIVLPAALRVDRVFPALSFDRPLGLVQAPHDDGHWYVVEQPGRILRFDDTTAVSTTETVLDLSAGVDVEIKT